MKNRKISLILFIIGALIEVAAYCISNLEHIPFFDGLVERQSTEAATAVRSITKGTVLKPNDPGFKQISEIIASYDPHISRATDITEIRQVPNEGFWFSPDAAVKSPVSVVLNNSMTNRLYLEDIDRWVHAVRGRNTFIVSLIVFALGLIVSMAGFRVERRSK